MVTKTFAAVLIQASLLATATAETVVGPDELVSSPEVKPVDVVKYVDEVENLDEEYGLFERFLQDGVSFTDAPSATPSVLTEPPTMDITDTPTMRLTEAPTAGPTVAPTLSTDVAFPAASFSLLSFSMIIDVSISFPQDMPTATPVALSTFAPTLEVPTLEPLSFSLFVTESPVAETGAPTGTTEGPTAMTESPTVVRRIRRSRI